MSYKGDRKCALYRVIHKESGKDYVGISVDYKRRWKRHVATSLREPTTYFQLALRKYGPDAFTWNVIAWCSSFAGAQTLERMARHLGMGYYNLTMGGEGILGCSPKHTSEWNERISKSNKGKPRPGAGPGKEGAEAMWRDPEFRAKQKVAQKAAWDSMDKQLRAEKLAKLAAGSRAYWSKRNGE